MRYTSSPMKLTGSYRIRAPREQVWQALLSPDVMKRILPGCEKLDPAGEHRYHATFRAGVGHIKGTFSGQISLTELDPPNSYTLRSSMKASTGFVEGSGRIELKDAAQAAAQSASLAMGAGAQSATASPFATPAAADVAADISAEAALPQTVASEELPSPETLVTYT